MKIKLFLIILITIFLLPLSSMAIETAPRISDRDIIESLVLLKSGQAALDNRIRDLHSEMKSGQAALDNRISDLRSEMKSGQAALRSEMKSGQAALGKRMDDMSSTMLTLFLGLMTLIGALFAYIAWDRRTMIRPIIDRLDNIEHKINRDLEIGNDGDSKLTRLIKAMQKLADHDPKVANVLRSFSLL